MTTVIARMGLMSQVCLSNIIISENVFFLASKHIQYATISVYRYYKMYINDYFFIEQLALQTRNN